MSLTVNIAWLLATLLLATRIGVATSLATVFGPANVPAPARIMISFGLAFAVVATGVTDGGSAQGITDLATLLPALLMEVVLGALFAFGFLAAYAATQVAGRVLDIQVGFGAASVLNPTTQTLSPLIGSLLGMVGVIIFLAFDGHHVLIRALALSVEAYPPGSMSLQLDGDAFFRQSALMFSYGLTLAAPVMFALLLADVAMAVFARSMPQLNVFVLSFAVKVMLGMICLAVSVRFADAAFARLFGTTFEYWRGVASPN